MNAAVSAVPSPARALPTAAVAKPASSSALPIGRRRKPRIATTTRAIEPATLPTIASIRAGKNARCCCASGIELPAIGDSSRHGEGDADGEADVDERDRAGDPHARQQERPGAEQRGGQKAAEEVVGAEAAVVPAGCGPGGDRGCTERVGGEPGRPREQVRLPLRTPARGEQPGEPEGQERSAEGEDRFHAGSVVTLCF